jgi:hypothetical protein
MVSPIHYVLDRFCLRILPQIHDKIKWLNLESLSMERILLATDYPTLCGLGLYNIDKETAMRLFRGNEFDFHFLIILLSKTNEISFIRFLI